MAVKTERGLFQFLYILSLSVSTAIFSGEPGLAGFIGAKDDGSGSENWSYKMCEAPAKCHHQQTNTQLFTGQTPFLIYKAP